MFFFILGDGHKNKNETHKILISAPRSPHPQESWQEMKIKRDCFVKIHQDLSMCGRLS